MTGKNYTLEELLSKMLVLQSTLEYEANALDALIKTAYDYAKGKDKELVYLFDTLKSRIDNIKHAVQTQEE